MQTELTLNETKVIHYNSIMVLFEMLQTYYADIECLCIHNLFVVAMPLIVFTYINLVK